MKAFDVICCLAVTCPVLVGQCTATYSDGSVDSGYTTFTAWASVTDYYNTGGQCTPPWYGFNHTYHATVSIVSPNGRESSNYSTSEQYGGGGTAYAATSLDIIEDGDYDVIEEESIDCTVAGTGFFTASRRSPMFGVGKVRTVYGFDSLFGGCSYHKSCSPGKNHWAGSQYTSMSINKPPNSCWNYVDKFHGFIKAGPFRTSWPITNEFGQSWVGHDAWYDCDGPMP